MKEKIMVAMSGGVDSSVAAKLLCDMGYDITGVTLKLFSNDEIVLNETTRTCCALSDIDDARNVCYLLSVEHFVFNFKELFIKEVMTRFAHSYVAGLTPNPCIDCNRYIKFSSLINKAKTLGYDKVATGHYANIIYDEPKKRYLLKRPLDRTKDQTYVLYMLTQEELAATLFPLGNMTKEYARNIAEAAGLINARKPDSQDICFVPDGDYNKFIENFLGYTQTSGNFIDIKGNILGKHKGITNYTIGQRKGLGISFPQPMFVINKNKNDNTVTLGEHNELFFNTVYAKDVNFISIDKLEAPLKALAKIRYNQVEQPVTIYPLENGEIKAVFDTPQRAITPGQAIVIYDDDIVVGGGTII